LKFIVDAMLGTLAKWLRIMGYDTLYEKNFSDDDLFFKAFLEDRILLTRDRELSERVGEKQSHFITEVKLKDQLRQLIARFELDEHKNLLSRCVLCNSPIVPITKEKVKDRVPDYVFETVSEFYFCENCNKIYWRGSHAEQIQAFLSEIKGEKP